MSLILFDLEPAVLRDDVYFREDFIALQARPDPVDTLETGDFRIGAAVRAIPGTTLTDLETPHGYGGPMARDGAALAAGLAAWRTRQRAAGRVAEFIRLHPCLNPEALAGQVDHLAFNRATVMVELRAGREARRARYAKTTRNILRRTVETVSVRVLRPDEGPLFQALYEAMLARHGAAPSYYFPPAYFHELLAAPWARTLVAEQAGEALAVSCFLAVPGVPLAHYHLSGGTAAGLAAQAQYPLLEAAFDHYTEAGCAWMHLGGGRTPAEDDGLWQFKAKFSPIQARFHVAGLIHDPEVFHALGGSRGGRFLGYRG
ncbi:MAG: GNAT family N-acetyltransferase [Rhodospirillaceae bacterium]